MKIVALCGMLDNTRRFPRFWNNYEKAFMGYYPNANFVVHTKFYWPWQFKKMTEYSDELISKYDDGEDIILLGHSLGGAIATAIAERFNKSRILMVVNVNAPVRFEWIFRKIYDGYGSKENNFPTVSFRSLFDTTVFLPLAYNKKAEKNILLFSNHMTAFMFFPSFTQKIAKISSEYLAGKNQ